MKKLVLFDWNGTLLNDTLLWYEAFSEVFHIFGKQPPPLERYFMELDGDYLIIYTSRGIDITRQELNEIYGKCYKKIMHRAELMPDTPKILQALQDMGYALHLVTGQLEYLVSPLLEKFNITSFFQCTRFHVTDKMSVINEIIEMENAEPAKCFYVGDTPSDVHHAKKSGVVSIALLGDCIANEIIERSNPDYTIINLKDILKIV